MTDAEDPMRLIEIQLPLHYAALVHQTLETTLNAQGYEGAKMLVTILGSFQEAIGDYKIPVADSDE